MTIAADTVSELALSHRSATCDSARMRANWDHWQRNAAQFGTEHSASWDDQHGMELEISNLLQHLRPGGRWLDAGCANGFTTFGVLAARPDEIRAFDYSPSMIEQAHIAQRHKDPHRTITFSHGNVLNIDEPDASFDQAYTVRVLINLPDWDAQQEAILEIHRVVKPGGTYILSEAFLGSLTRLNALRGVGMLAPLCEPNFNRYLEEDRLESFLRGRFEIAEIERFSSLYYVATRFLRELATDPEAPADYDHPLNRLAAGLSTTSRSGDFGIQKAYVLNRL